MKIAITIKEGKRAKIRQINIVGNESYREQDIRENFTLDTANWLSWIRQDDRYAKESLSGDLETLRSFYMDRGYADFRIESTQVAISPDKQDIYVTINIHEGEQYKISEIKMVYQPEMSLLVQSLLLNAIDLVVEVPPGKIAEIANTGKFMIIPYNSLAFAFFAAAVIAAFFRRFLFLGLAVRIFCALRAFSVSSAFKTRHARRWPAWSASPACAVIVTALPASKVALLAGLVMETTGGLELVTEKYDPKPARTKAKKTEEPKPAAPAEPAAAAPAAPAAPASLWEARPEAAPFDEPAPQAATSEPVSPAPANAEKPATDDDVWALPHLEAPSRPTSAPAQAATAIPPARPPAQPRPSRRARSVSAPFGRPTCRTAG